MPEIIGDYQYSKRDLIGHGAFAIVFLGRSRLVNIYQGVLFFLFIIFYFLSNRILNNKWQLNRSQKNNYQNHKIYLKKKLKFLK